MTAEIALVNMPFFSISQSSFGTVIGRDRFSQLRW